MNLKLSKKHQDKLILIILDGFGEPNSDELNDKKTNQFNAILQARTPFFDWINSSGQKKIAKTLINASSNDVGLPDNQMGNSEVGHLNIGAGRVVYQDIVRINKAIENGDFFNDDTLNISLNKLAETKKSLHIFGLASDGGVHSHQDQILALFKLACEKNINQIYLHLILDGRDVPPRSALSTIELFEENIKKQNNGKIASLIGRFYAMDRDQRWERIQKAYDLYSTGKAENRYFENAKDALLNAYENNENDEFVSASNIGGYKGIEDNDLVIFMNFRSDRARQLTRVFADKRFNEFETKKIKLQDFITLTEYQSNSGATVIFKPTLLNNTLGEVLSTNGKRQLRIAETEKYAHVTYFFSGGREQLFDGEERKLIPSPQVKTYDLKPEMSAYELTDCLIDTIQSDQFDFIVCNYANPDMVGHTGNMEAAKKAIETVDECMLKLYEVATESNFQIIITADHGNIEKMFNYQTNQIHTAHTTNPVPLYYLGDKAILLKKDGKLANIAPTILDLMNISKPKEMTESSLIIKQ